ncbi:MAG TPA: M23 family metallopeptidase [Actinomycetota bacterium]
MRRPTALVILALALAGQAAADGAGPALDLIPPIDGPIARHFDEPAGPYAPGHRGIDFDAPAGSPVVAAATGTVAFAGRVGESLFVSIDHPDGSRTTYSFLSAVEATAGQAVAQGEEVARSGSGHPGSADPPHLHFGLRRGDLYLDPEPVLLAGFRRDLSRVVSLSA